jgi:hypothetical protein
VHGAPPWFSRDGPWAIKNSAASSTFAGDIFEAAPAPTEFGRLEHASPAPVSRGQEPIIPTPVSLNMLCDMPIFRFGNRADSPDTGV